jgi:hypothetical protein
MPDNSMDFEDRDNRLGQLGRKAYEPPRLISLGPLQALVLGPSTGNADPCNGGCNGS